MSKLVIAIGVLAIGLVVLFGLYLFLKGARNVQMALASTKWPQTSGIVVRSETTRSVVRGTRTSPGSVMFATKTVIRYVVNGQQYSTDVLHFGQTLGSDDKSEAALQRIRYPSGKKVTVSYNPRNPSAGVMKPGLHAEAFWLPGAGLAFLLPAVLCLIVGHTMVRGLTTDDHTFANSVRGAIEEAGRNAGPIAPIPPPRDAGGDAVMIVLAAAFGAVACGLGVLALTAGLQRIWHGYASENWPTTQGVVIFTSQGGGQNGEDAADDSMDTSTYAQFVYQYEVAGTKHFNNVRRFAQVEGGSTQEADQVASRYSKGAAVKVSYFPTDPDVAVLEPGNTNASLVLPGLGVVLILFGLAIFIWVVPAVARP
jgi:hypothetical protein